MAAMATTTSFAGLEGSPFSQCRASSKPSLGSSFLRPQAASRNPLKQKVASGGKFTWFVSGTVAVTSFERDWLRKDLNVIGFGLIGWLVPPSSIPAINGDSLTGLFFQRIGTELSHWPTGPALTSQFWLWLITSWGSSFASPLARLGSREGLGSTSKSCNRGICNSSLACIGLSHCFESKTQ